MMYGETTRFIFVSFLLLCSLFSNVVALIDCDNIGIFRQPQPLRSCDVMFPHHTGLC